jgi:transposase
MGELYTIGLDIAKDVFQVHGTDIAGAVVLQKKLKRADVIEFFKGVERCLVGIEACATSHYWARLIRAAGHDVKLMPTRYVKAYVKTNKNDANDAEAICEAVRRPNMRFVPVKSEDQQAILVVHRVRALLVEQQTMLVNALRAHLAEFGIIARRGSGGANQLIAFARTISGNDIPGLARKTLRALAEQIQATAAKAKACELQIVAWHKKSQESRRIAAIPGVGPLSASAIIATIGDASGFRSGRQFAAWIGLVPRQWSSGNRILLGHISKRGNGYLRRLLYLCARAAMNSKAPQARMVRWALRLRERKSFSLVAIALANRIARIAWVLVARDQAFRPG